MKKAIICLATALTAIISIAPSYTFAATDQDFIEKDFENYIKLDDWKSFFNGKYEEVYIQPNDEHGATFYFIKSYPDMINFTVSRDIDDKKLESQIKEIDEGLILTCSVGKSADEYNCMITRKNQNSEYTRIESNTVKKLYNILGDYVNGFVFNYDRYTYHYSTYNYITEYDLYLNAYEVEEKLNDYINNYNINASLLKNNDRNSICVVPKNDITFMEHYKIAEDIIKKTGLHPYGITPNGNEESVDKVINLDNFINGDANCDKEVGLADSLAILQYTANAEKYPLSDQALFNADIVGDGDGVTPLDALEIQIWDSQKKLS